MAPSENFLMRKNYLNSHILPTLLLLSLIYTYSYVSYPSLPSTSAFTWTEFMIAQTEREPKYRSD